MDVLKGIISNIHEYISHGQEEYEILLLGHSLIKICAQQDVEEYRKSP